MAQPPSFESLLLQVDGAVARVTLNRPQRLNALRATKRRFAAVLDSLCTVAGSQADADDLLAAYGDAETLAAQRAYRDARGR